MRKQKDGLEIETKKGSVRQSFTSRSFKSGSYSLVLCAVVLVIAVLINLIVAALPSKVTEPDVSANGLFTLSDYSKQIAQGLKTDVTIYQLATEKDKDPYVSRLLERYTEISDKIKVEMRDPEVSQIATQYTQDAVSANTLIFVSEKRNKVVAYSSLYGYSANSYYSGGQSSPDEFRGEQEITSALQFVTSDVLPKVYVLTGHGEYTVSDTLTSAIISQNIETETLDLMKTKEIPEDCACLLLLAPTSDLNEKEQGIILDYLDNGGRLLTATMTKNNLKSETPHFDALLQNCGVLAGDGFLVENDSNMVYYMQTYLLPELESHEITDPLIENKYHVLLPICRNLQIDPDVRSGITVTPLMHSSDSAFARTDVSIETVEKAESDIDGPFDVAYAVEGEEGMRAVIFSSPYFMEDEFNGLPGNMNILLNSLKWMCDLEENISVVDVKSLSSGGVLEVDNMTGTLWITVFIFVLPFSMLIAGIVVYVQRKKR